MQRVLIFSDTHGDIRGCEDVINNFEYRISAIIHAGDHARDAEDLQSIYPEIPVYYVCGNTDFMSNAPVECTVVIGGARVFVTHGHEYRVKQELRYTTLKVKGEEIGADLVVFGHTHVPITEFHGKTTLINPGSIRFDGHYAVAEIENGKVKTTIKQCR